MFREDYPPGGYEVLSIKHDFLTTTRTDWLVYLALFKTCLC
jgi:hypothetical protein